MRNAQTSYQPADSTLCKMEIYATENAAAFFCEMEQYVGGKWNSMSVSTLTGMLVRSVRSYGCGVEQHSDVKCAEC